jgi:formylglycine-generating enzyme required for sulfatase activity
VPVVAGEEKPSKEEVKGWGKSVTNSIGMKLVRIPPGTFKMGSPADEKLREEPHEYEEGSEQQHEVEITKEFWLGMHEVTQKQFKAVMGYNPSCFSADGTGRPGASYPDWHKPAVHKDSVAGKATDDFPVENVSWNEAKEFCEKLSARSAEKTAVRVHRLPTEAEWEYSCRGGAPSYQVFHFGNSLSSKQANFDGTSPYGGAEKGPYLRRTEKVGSYAANRFGLYVMHGNVCEWCADYYDKRYYGKSRRRDPQGPLKGDVRVYRGGGADRWATGGSCRSASRNHDWPEASHESLGFRVVLVPGGR